MLKQQNQKPLSNVRGSKTLSGVFEDHGLLENSYTPDFSSLNNAAALALTSEVMSLENLPLTTRFSIVQMIDQNVEQQEKIKSLSWKLREAEVREAMLESKIVRLENQNNNLGQKAYSDELTGINNRAYFVEVLDEQTRRKTDQAAVIFIDLCKFKPINDTYGHEAGDKALQHVAHVLRTIVRGDDDVARWGGDEFVLKIKNINSVESREIVARLEKELENLAFAYDGQLIEFSARLGVTNIEVGQKPLEIMHAADIEMMNNKDPEDREGPVQATVLGANAPTL